MKPSSNSNKTINSLASVKPINKKTTALIAHTWCIEWWTLWRGSRGGAGSCHSRCCCCSLGVLLLNIFGVADMTSSMGLFHKHLMVYAKLLMPLFPTGLMLCSLRPWPLHFHDISIPLASSLTRRTVARM